MADHQAPPSLGFSRQEHWSGLPLSSPMQESEKWRWSHSVVSNCKRPHGLQPTRLLHPWDFPGKSTGVGCHCLLQRYHYSLIVFPFLIKLNKLLYAIQQFTLNGIYPKELKSSVQFSSVAQWCPTLCDPMNHSTPGLPVHYQVPEFTQRHVHRIGDATQLSHPLSSPSPHALNPSQH